jgi:hypothetical protein
MRESFVHQGRTSKSVSDLRSSWLRAIPISDYGLHPSLDKFGISTALLDVWIT